MKPFSEKPSPKDLKKIHNSFNVFWKLVDNPKRVPVLVASQNLIHAKPKDCPFLDSIPRYLTCLIESIDDPWLKRLMSEQLNSRDIGDMMAILEWTASGDFTEVVVQTQAGATDVFLKHSFEGHPSVKLLQTIDDRTISALIKNQPEQFCNILAENGVKLLTDVRADRMQNGTFFEKTVVAAYPEKMGASYDAINSSGHLQITFTTEGRQKIEVEKSVIESSQISKLWGMHVFDPKGERLLSNHFSKTDYVSVSNTRERPKRPMKQEGFLEQRTEEFELMEYFALSGLSEIPYKRIVTDCLETNGLRLANRPLNSFAINELLYRAKRISVIQGFNELERQRELMEHFKC
jgi:hypothetical protein